MLPIKPTLIAIGLTAALAGAALAQNFQGAGVPWELREGTGYVVDMQGKMTALPIDAVKHHAAMMTGATEVPRGTMFFMSGGKLYMRSTGNFDRNGNWMFN